jgi:hypothetical protein
LKAFIKLVNSFSSPSTPQPSLNEGGCPKDKREFQGRGLGDGTSYLSFINFTKSPAVSKFKYTEAYLI